MKRNADTQTASARPHKRMKTDEDSDTSSEASDRLEWPAPAEALAAARLFLKRCATAGKTTVIVPDKDADGLCGGSIIHRTLVALGHPADSILLHLVSKGSNVHEEREHTVIRRMKAGFIIAVDQGSRPTRITAEDDEAEVLVIDHHLSNEFPPGATVLTACHNEPVATSALLAYILCQPLHRSVPKTCDWLACMGTIGDLGSAFKWERPFPDMKETFKMHTKKSMTDAVSLINAPRRTATYDVASAWNAVNAASSPADILSPSSPHHRRLVEARNEINQEVERCSHSPPKFSADGQVALLRITSQAQVHPVVATRWAGHLKSSALEIVMVANDGYLPGMVNFSCRVARCAYARKAKGEAGPNIIETLKHYADRHEPAEGEISLRERLGDNFARGHKQASGGIVSTGLFEEFCLMMEIGEPSKVSPKKKPAQKNTLDGYFKKG